MGKLRRLMDLVGAVPRSVWFSLFDTKVLALGAVD